jgi:hypothetical protein
MRSASQNGQRPGQSGPRYWEEYKPDAYVVCSMYCTAKDETRWMHDGADAGWVKVQLLASRKIKLLGSTSLHSKVARLNSDTSINRLA